MHCHHLACHTVMLMGLHMCLGQFSNSVLEAFHKIVRWFYQHTNREGGANKTESTEAVMTKYFGLKILEIESRSPCAKAQIQAMVRSPRAECECASSGICGWGSKKRKPEEEPEGAVYCTPCRPQTNQQRDHCKTQRKICCVYTKTNRYKCTQIR